MGCFLFVSELQPAATTPVESGAVIKLTASMRGRALLYPSWLIPYKPLVPLDILIERINSIYHSFDAERYDSEVIELRRTWPALWAEMLQQLPPRKCWRILDFGCGTGFEAGQAIRFLGDKISVLMAYDPSPNMLGQARARIMDPKIVFTCDESSIWSHAPYDLLITNSVLHHLPAIPDFRQYTAENAYWLAGNEPSSRFYANPECVRLSCEYATHQERMKWLRPSRYVDKIKSMLHLDSLSKTADVAHKRRLLAVRPHPDIVSRLVDFRVRDGFDLATMNPGWRATWRKTYSYLGAFSEVRAPRKWRQRAGQLQGKFPEDGACFCAVWQRL